MSGAERERAGNGEAPTIRDALRTPRGARAPLGALIGRLPLTIGVLVIVALVEQHRSSYALAGLASGCYGLAMAAGHPWLGRRVDGVHSGRVLIASAALCAIGWSAVVLSTALLPGWTVVLAAAAAGASQPPLSPAMRAHWSRLVGAETLERAYAFETTVQEVAFVAGPLILTGILAVATPSVAAFACAALVLLGASLFASGTAASGVKRSPTDSVRAAGPLTTAGIRALAATRCLCSIGLGIALVCIPAFAIAHRERAFAGAMLAAWSAGSLCGGALYAIRSWRAALSRRYMVFLCLGSLPMAGMAFAPNILAFASLAVLSGLGLAPWVACGDALVQRMSPAGTMTEAFTWIASLGLVGEALGAALAGVLLDQAGVSGALAAAGAAAVLAALLAVLTNSLLAGTDRLAV